jgi:hypothetical protein
MAGIDITQHAICEPISLGIAKSQLQLDSGFTQDDEYIRGLIRSARKNAELHTARAYVTQGFREYFDGFPEDRLPIPYNVIYDLPTRHDFEPRQHNRFELSRSPLQLVADIQYLDCEGNTQTLDPSLYYVAPWKEPARICHAPHCWWPRPLHREDSVWVDYTAGYGSLVPLSIAASSDVTSGAVFARTNVGQRLMIPGAGPAIPDDGSAPLQATILSVDDSGNATLSASAVTPAANAPAWLGSPVDPTARQAMLLLITHWYENRLPIASVGLKELPYAIKELLDGNRVYYQA